MIAEHFSFENTTSINSNSIRDSKRSTPNYITCTIVQVSYFKSES